MIILEKNLKKYFKKNINKLIVFFIIIFVSINIPTLIFSNYKDNVEISNKPDLNSYGLLKIRTPFISSWKNNIKKKVDLKFGNDGIFKIVQFSDIQDGPDTDHRTIDLMNKILDFEEPELVVLTGDNIDGRCNSIIGIKKAISNIAKPMESRQIPWAIVFGNHDEENNVLSKSEMMKLYMSYPYNISQSGPKDIDGVGNYNLPIKDSSGEKTIFNVYMLDSGSYAPNNIGGYAWIKPSQIEWYRKTAIDLKNKNNKIIPSLMFFHIPLPEFKQLWSSGKTIGHKNESEDPPRINSGLFSNLLDIGDVLGVFVGHDHTNDYMGDLFGIKLGFSRNIGYGTYGKSGFARGSRVFSISESDTSHFKTWMRLASDFS